MNERIFQSRTKTGENRFASEENSRNDQITKEKRITRNKQPKQIEKHNKI